MRPDGQPLDPTVIDALALSSGRLRAPLPWRLESDSPAGYAMAHSTETYLLDTAGRLRHRLFFGASPALIAERIREVAG